MSTGVLLVRTRLIGRATVVLTDQGWLCKGCGATEPRDAQGALASANHPCPGATPDVGMDNEGRLAYMLASPCAGCQISYLPNRMAIVQSCEKHALMLGEQ